MVGDGCAELESSELSKGIYDFLVEALGSHSEAFERSEIQEVTDLSIDEKNRRLISLWGEGSFRVGVENNEILFFLQKKLDGDQTVTLVARQYSRISAEGGENHADFSIEDLIISGSSKHVNLSERMQRPNLVMQLGTFVKPDIVISEQADVLQKFYYQPSLSNPFLGEINFGSITSVADLAGILHENGHRKQYQRFSSNELVLNNWANDSVEKMQVIFDAYGPTAVAEAEDELFWARFKTADRSQLLNLQNHDMGIIEAFQIKSRQERSASDYAKEEIAAIKDLLGFSADQVANAAMVLEKCWQTYDSFPFLPTNQTSELARSIPTEKKQVIWDYLATFDGILFWLKKAGLQPDGPRLTIRVKGEGDYQIWLKEKMANVCYSFYPEDTSQSSVTALLCPLGGMIVLPDTEKSGLSLKSPQEFLFSENPEKVLAVSRKVEELLTERFRETLSNDAL
jgi:hypothetical protein